MSRWSTVGVGTLECYLSDGEDLDFPEAQDGRAIALGPCGGMRLAVYDWANGLPGLCGGMSRVYTAWVARNGRWVRSRDMADECEAGRLESVRESAAYVRSLPWGAPW